MNLEALVSVTTDTTGAQLKSDSLEQRYYIQDGDKTIGVSHLWGGWIDFSQNEAWGTSTFVREPLAVEAHSFKSSEGENVAGYIVATKNTFTDSWGENIEFEIEYVLPSGIVDEGLRVHTNSIKNKESLFGQDLDGDTAIGLDPTKFSAISTDTYGDLLKYQGEVLYIIDDKDTEIATDDSVIEIVDAWDHTPWFDYQESWGTGDYIQEDSRAAFAVESFDDINGNKNFLLGIKQESSFGGGETETFWETFRIKEENPGENDWYLDWDSGSFSKGARRLEAKFNQDLNGNGQIDSGSISTTNVLTDQSSTGQRGAALAMDDEGSLYIKQGTGNPILIEDNYGPVTFDYSETWGSYSRTSAYAVEGILNTLGTSRNTNLLFVIKRLI